MTIRKRGFTLIELMITVAVVAILAAIAYPSYQDSLRKSRRTDGKNALTQAVANMERYYTERGSTYATAELCPDTTLATPNLPAICPGSCAAPAGGACTSTEGNYIITFPAAPTAIAFSILATPQGSQAIDGRLSIDSTNAKKQDINNNGTFEASENYWK